MFDGKITLNALELDPDVREYVLEYKKQYDEAERKMLEERQKELDRKAKNGGKSSSTEWKDVMSHLQNRRPRN